MSDNFSEIWKNRNSTEPKDQVALYLEIQSLFKGSSIRVHLNLKDRDDFFQDFYIYKILHSLSAGLAISKPKYDDMYAGQLINMMKQYNISLYWEEKNKISSSQNSTEDVDEIPLTDSTLECYQQQSLNEMTDKAIDFIVSSEPWVLTIIVKSATGDRFSGNDYPRRAKLGLTLKKSFHTGAVSLEDYHKNTIIGRWIIKTYSEDVLPFTKVFFAGILKSLHDAALYLNRKGR